MLLVTALTAVSLAISLYVFDAQDRTVDAMLSAYVLDLAETFAENAPTAPLSAPPGPRGRAADEERHHMPRRRLQLRMFSVDPSLHTGGILLFNRDKKRIGASDGAEALESLWRGDLVLGEPAVVPDDGGKKYHVVVRQLSGGNYVMVAASRSRLISSISGMWRFWLVSVMAASAAVLIGIIALWRYLVIPLRRIVETVSSAVWGRDLPRFGRPALYEVNELARVIEKSAEEAVAKEGLRVRYIGDLVQAQEDARKRLARELHDGPLQFVVASIKRIQLAQVTAEPGGRTRLDEAERVSQDAADEIRNYCDELSPSWTALGAASALEELTERLAMTHGVRIELHMDDDYDTLPDETVLALIRILQEAVSNAVRHGGATEIVVSLTRADAALCYAIEDDGSGFPDARRPAGEPDFEALRLAGHRGLSNMHERVQLLGGQLEIGPARCADFPEGRPGCRIAVRLPLGMPPR